MDILKQMRGSASWERVFIAVLIVFILFGLATRLYLSTRFELNSDTVGMGLESMEIGRYGNYLLSGYHATAADTFYLTELVPFQLIPQILTDYDPLALKMVSYLIFILCLLVLSYIVYSVSGSTTSALVFAALAANVPVDGYWQLAMPTTHNATIFFGGIVFILLLVLSKYLSARKEKPAKDNSQKRKKSGVQAIRVPWKYLVVLFVLVFTITLSDTIFLVWFLAPCILVYLFFYKNKNDLSNRIAMGMVALSALAYFIKTYLIHDWVVQPLLTRNLSDILSVNLPLFFKSMALFLNKPLFDISNGSFAPGAVEIVSIAAFLVISAYTIYGVSNEGPGKKQFFYLIMAGSIVLMFLAFLVSEYARDLGGARYLTFTALAIMMVVAVSCNAKKYPLFGVAILLLLITSAVFTCTYVTTASLAPNEKENDLIGFLKGNNLTFGAGTYWNSNIVTYLSGEDVTIRSATFTGNGLYYDQWLSCDRWYKNPPSRGFIIMENGTITGSYQEEFNSLLGRMNASTPIYYGQYDIFPYNWTG